MRTGPRGSGRTYRQLKALPDGATFVVEDGMINYARAMLRAQGRCSHAVNVVAVFALIRSPWAGWNGPLALDHDVEVTPKLASILHALNGRITVRWPHEIPPALPGEPGYPVDMTKLPKWLLPKLGVEGEG